MLKEIAFTDLFLESDGTAHFKTGHKISPAELQKEYLQGLYCAISEKSKNVEEGRSSFRMAFDGVTLRVQSFSTLNKDKVYFVRRTEENLIDFADLGYAKPIADWLLSSKRTHGLIVFCGSQATGKTTSAASLISKRLTLYGGHGVGFEDPPEMPLEGNTEFIFYQSEVSREQMGESIRLSYRCAAPNIILIGEVRNEKEVAREAINAALGSDSTLVIITLHAASVQAAIEKLILLAAAIDSPEIAANNLSQALLAIVSQEIEDSPNSPTGKRVKVKEFLFLPFTSESQGIRAKINDQALSTLQEDLKQQKSKLAIYGELPQ